MLFMSHKLLSDLGLGEMEVVCHVTDSRCVLCWDKCDWIFQACLHVHLLSAAVSSCPALGWVQATTGASRLWSAQGVFTSDVDPFGI